MTFWLAIFCQRFPLVQFFRATTKIKSIVNLVTKKQNFNKSDYKCCESEYYLHICLSIEQLCKHCKSFIWMGIFFFFLIYYQLQYRNLWTGKSCILCLPEQLLWIGKKNFSSSLFPPIANYIFTTLQAYHFWGSAKGVQNIFIPLSFPCIWAKSWGKFILATNALN